MVAQALGLIKLSKSADEATSIYSNFYHSCTDEAARATVYQAANNPDVPF